MDLSKLSPKELVLLARNPNTSPEVLAQLANNPDVGVRREVAQNENVPSEVLAQLVNDSDIRVRYGVACNRSTLPETLAQLASDLDNSVRFQVARNPNTPLETLVKLASDLSDNIRSQVALNRRTPSEVLTELARDSGTKVRDGVAQNPSTPPEVLIKLASDPSGGVRRGVAQNQKTPSEVLTKLADDSSAGVRYEVALHLNTPPEILARLANDPNWGVRQGVAYNPNTPPEILAKLAEDPDRKVREGVARNPNTSSEVLAKLTQALTQVAVVDLRQEYKTKAVQTVVPGMGPVTIFTDDGLRARPVHPDLMLVLPEASGLIAHERGILAVKHFIGTPAGKPVPEERLEQLVLAVQFATPEIPQPLMMPIESEGIEFVEEKVSVPVTSEGEELPEEPEPEAKPLGTVRLVALVDPFDVFNGQTGLLSTRLKDTNLIRFVFDDPVPATPEIKQKLKNVPKLRFNQVPQSGIPHVEMSESYVYALWYPFEEWEWVRVASRRLGMDLSKLSRDELVSLARNPNTPLEVLAQLAKHPDVKVRSGVAWNRSTPPEILAQLASDSDSEVRSGVARNRSTPPEILAQLASDSDSEVRSGVAWNRSTPPEILAQLASDSDSRVRSEVSWNLRTPLEALAQLARDSDSGIRRFVARNPNTPPEVLSWLAGDRNYRVREEVARHPNTPSEVLSQLARSRSRLIRGLVARHPNTPLEVLSQLARDHDYYVRELAVRNPNTPLEVLLQLANDPDQFVRGLVARNPNTPSEILLRLVDDPSQQVREEVARHPNTPPEVLAKFTQVVIVDLDKGYKTKAVQTAVPGIGPITIFTDDNLKARLVDPNLLGAGHLGPRSDMIFHEQGVLAVKHFLGTPTGESISEERLEQLIFAVQFATPEIPQPLTMPVETEGVEFVEEPAHVLVTSEGEELPEEPEPEAKPLGAVRLVALATPFDTFNGQTGLLSTRLKGTNLTRFVFDDPVPVTPEIKQRLENVPKLRFNQTPQSGIPHVEMSESYVYALWYPFEEWEWVRVADRRLGIDLSKLSQRELISLAENPNTPPEVLAQLASYPDYTVRYKVAKNQSTPPEILARLANDSDYRVRAGVAANRSTPPEILTRLASDSDPGVRRTVADNASVPSEVLILLAHDSDTWVRCLVSHNPSLPSEILLRLVDDPEPDVREAVARSPYVPFEALLRLADDPSGEVREAVADNSEAFPEVLARLTQVVIVDLDKGYKTKAVQTIDPEIGPITIFVDDNLRARPIHPDLFPLPDGIETLADIRDSLVLHEQGVLAVTHFLGTPTGKSVPKERLEQLMLAVQFATPEIPQPLMIPIESEGIEFVEEPAPVPVTSEGEELPEKEPEPEAKPLGAVRLVTLVSPFDVFNGQTGLLSVRLGDTNLIRFVFEDPVPVTPEIKQKLENVPKLRFNQVPQRGIPHVEMSESYVYALWYPFEEWEWVRVANRRLGMLSPVALQRLAKIEDLSPFVTKFGKDKIWVERKYDGILSHTIVDEDGRVHIFTRRGVEITENFSPLVKKIEALNLPPDTYLIGELVWYDNAGFQREPVVMSIAGSDPEAAKEKITQYEGHPAIVYFDVLYVDGKDVTKEPLKDRRERLEGLLEDKADDYIRLSPVYTYDQWQQAMQDALAENGEGIVAKYVEAPYVYKELGEREPLPGTWVKMKVGGKDQEDSFVVYNLTTSETGKLMIEFGQFYRDQLYHVGRLDNFSREVEEEIKRLFKQQGPFVVDLGFEERTGDGKLRHPKFIRIRYDLDAKDVNLPEGFVDTLEPVSLRTRRVRGTLGERKLLGVSRDEQILAAIQAAQDPNTPPEVLAQLAYDPSWVVRQEVARNPNTSLEVLVRLAKDSDWVVRQEVARNPNTPSEVLTRLAKDSDGIVRSNVAQNSNTPPEALSQLANDLNWGVRREVARNSNAPPEALIRLANDPNWEIRREVARNPNTSLEVLTRLARDSDDAVRGDVAHNSNTPPEVLAQLVNDPNWRVRREVAHNPNTPPEVLAQLVTDPDSRVFFEAVSNPNMPYEARRVPARVVTVKLARKYRTKAVQTQVPDIGWVTIFTDDNLRARPVHPDLILDLPLFEASELIAHERGVLAVRGFIGTPTDELISKERLEQLIFAVQFATPEIPQPLMIPVESEGIEFVEEPAFVPVTSEGEELPEEPEPEAKPLGTVRLVTLVSPFDVFNGQTGLLSTRLKGTNLIRFVFDDPVPVTPGIKQKLENVPKLRFNQVPQSNIPHVEMSESYVYALWYPFEEWEWVKVASNMNDETTKVIAIDFDYTLYDPAEQTLYEGADGALQTLNDMGWTIIIFTANPDHEFIERVLRRANVPFHAIVAKPEADLYVDDRAVNVATPEDLVQQVQRRVAVAAFDPNNSYTQRLRDALDYVLTQIDPIEDLAKAKEVAIMYIDGLKTLKTNDRNNIVYILAKASSTDELKAILRRSLEVLRPKVAQVKHPEKVKIESKYGKLTEQDIYNYWVRVKDKIMPYLQGRNVYLIWGINGTLLRRHEPRSGEFYKIDTDEDYYKHIAQGHILEVHVSLDPEDDIIFVDLDPQPGFPFDDVKQVAAAVYRLLRQEYDLKELMIKLSGSERGGIHIYGILKEKQDVDKLRGELRELLDREIVSKDSRLTTKVTRKRGTMRLDVSTLHTAGGIRAPWSLHSETGLVSVPISDLSEFKPEDAKPQLVVPGYESSVMSEE